MEQFGHDSGLVRPCSLGFLGFAERKQDGETRTLQVPTTRLGLDAPAVPLYNLLRNPQSESGDDISFPGEERFKNPLGIAGIDSRRNGGAMPLPVMRKSLEN